MVSFQRLAKIALSVGLIISAGLCRADEPGTAPVEPVLQAVESRLREALGDLDPAPAYRVDGTTLVVEWRTQKFLVHPRTKSGEIAPQAREEVGPSHLGFVLNVHVQPAGEVNAAVTPQTLHTPYWETALDVTQVPSTDRQLFWGLSYGSRTDRKVLEIIRQSIILPEARLGKEMELHVQMALHKPPYVHPVAAADPSITFERVDLVSAPVLSPCQPPSSRSAATGATCTRPRPSTFQAASNDPARTSSSGCRRRGWPGCSGCWKGRSGLTNREGPGRRLTPTPVG